MLLRQDFRRRHECDLATVLDGDNRGLEGHDCLSRPHVSLQQPPHGIWLFHVGGDFLQDAFLCSRWMEWQNLLDRLASAILQSESNAGLRSQLPPTELQT